MRIFIKMELKVHPHEIIARFMNFYETYIEPSLNEGKKIERDLLEDIATSKEVSLNMVRLASGIMQEGVLPKYFVALSALKALAEGEDLDDYFVATAERNLADIDLILSGDEFYDPIRRESY